MAGVKKRRGGGRERLRKAWKGKGPLPSLLKPPPFFPFFPVPYPFLPLLLLGIDIIHDPQFDSSVGNKLSLYSELKNEVRFESYLDLIKNVKTRVAVTKMRISCHLLPIESGHYKTIPRVERLCPFCNRSEIGDEFHYLLKCTHSSLSHIRDIFLESLYSINSNLTNMSCKALFLYITSMCDENIKNPTASYIENILNCCKSELNFLTIRVG